MVESSKSATPTPKNRHHNTLVPVDGDHLGLKHEAKIMGQLEHDELLVFSSDIKKRNRFGMWQNRHLLLTTNQMCNVKKFTIKRNIIVPKICALTKGTDPGLQKQFIVHVENEYDYHMECNKLDELFKAVKESYYRHTNKNLPIYGVPGDIKEFVTSK